MSVKHWLKYSPVVVSDMNLELYVALNLTKFLFIKHRTPLS